MNKLTHEEKVETIRSLIREGKVSDAQGRPWSADGADWWPQRENDPLFDEFDNCKCGACRTYRSLK